MPDKKHLRIGVTVNLENYENLRVEVEGDVSEDRGTDELIDYLDTVLKKFGNNDPDTKKRVDSYRIRVIRPKTKDSEDIIIETETSESPSDMNLRREIIDKSKEKYEYPDKLSECQEGIIHYNENNKIINKTGLCEICSSPVTPQAEHASRVIDGRVLCRKCLKNIQEKNKPGSKISGDKR